MVAHDWYGNGVSISVKGKLELYQQSEYEITNVDVHFQGLNETSGYHVHEASIQENLLFPCEATTIYDHWNPRNVNPKGSPPPQEGSTDAYEMGDLSGKFGTLDHLTDLVASYNDTNIPLFGYETVLGRSIVIHKKMKNVRWACSSLERGYSPQESREIRAIASFHHPKGHAYGYMRFRQLIHSDGSKSDTTIEVNLRHPGVNDRNVVCDFAKQFNTIKSISYLFTFIDIFFRRGIIIGKSLLIQLALMQLFKQLLRDALLVATHGIHFILN